MLNKIHATITAIAIGGCIVLFILLQRSCNEADKGKNFETMYNASQDSLHKKINKDGTETATTALLYGSIDNLKKIHASDSSTIGKLKNLVDKMTISATILKTSTSGTASSATIITKHDTVRGKGKDSLIYIYPEYTLKRDSGKWHDISGVATKDSFTVKYKVFNEYDFKQEFMSQGTGLKKIFGRKVPMVSVTNLNPHTETRELKSFAVQPKKYSRLKDIALGAILIEVIRGIFLAVHK